MEQEVAGVVTRRTAAATSAAGAGVVPLSTGAQVREAPTRTAEAGAATTSTAGVHLPTAVGAATTSTVGVPPPTAVVLAASYVRSRVMR